MLDPEYSWLFDCDAGQQAPDFLLDAGTYPCTDGGDLSAGFDLSSVAQEPSTFSTTQMNDSQQSLWFDGIALPADQGVDFASLFTDANVSAPNPNLDPAVVGQNVGSLPAYRDPVSAHQEIGAEHFYRNTQSPLVHQYIDLTVVNECANLYDTSAVRSMQHVPDSTLREELERSLLEEAPGVLEFGAGFENADKGPQLDREQPRHNRRHESVEPPADTRERLSKQNERIRELELALQQLQQLQQTCPELPQMSVPIPSLSRCL
jgi:hypothetical protein